MFSHHRKMRPVVMQEKLLQACPGIDIMVFGRHKDFANQVKANSKEKISTWRCKE